MMSMSARRELLAQVAPRYQEASGLEKIQILDEFVANTGYHRKYAIRVLKHVPRPRTRLRRTRKRKYTPAVRQALVTLWRAADCICGKRLAPFLPELAATLERYGELRLDDETRALLREISPATVDRLLRPTRVGHARRGLSTTKPGTLLKKQIPIRTFADWQEDEPGFLEIDLVAHCGTATDGEYLNTLVLTDIQTTWTECIALPNRSQRAVSTAIRRVREEFPFAILGLDSDNGSEFINANLLRYCQQEQITFTRSRPYKKNDQAHVEQKNWTHVRHFIGYGRYEGSEARQILRALYERLNLYMNFFQPTLKLVEKRTVNGRVRKKYDEARTPFRRAMACDQVSDEMKANLQAIHEMLNPLSLLEQIERLQSQLWKLEVVRFTNEATIPPE